MSPARRWTSCATTHRERPKARAPIAWHLGSSKSLNQNHLSSSSRAMRHAATKEAPLAYLARQSKAHGYESGKSRECFNLVWQLLGRRTYLTPLTEEPSLPIHFGSLPPPPPRRRPAPHARRTARSAGWARGKGAGSHRRSAVWAAAAGCASAAGKFSDETTKLTGEPGLREVPAEGCGHAS